MTRLTTIPRRVILSAISQRLATLARWDLHFLAVRLRNSLTGQSRRIRKFVRAREHPRLLNLGSGPRGLADEHWVNVDGFKDRNVHFVLDFSRPFPLQDNSFECVFSEHVLEHFSYADGQSIASEVLRVLSAGGVFRVVVPDARKIMAEYFERPAQLVVRRDKGMTAGEAVNSYFRQGYEHQFLYDAETIEKMLLGAGFSTVYVLSFRNSTSKFPVAIDDPKYEWESLYVEAVK